MRPASAAYIGGTRPLRASTKEHCTKPIPASPGSALVRYCLCIGQVQADRAVGAANLFNSHQPHLQLPLAQIVSDCFRTV